MAPSVLGGDLSLTSTGAAQITDTGHVSTWVKTTDPLPCHQGHRPCPDKHHPDLIEVHHRIRSIALWFTGLVTVNTRLVVLEGPAHGAQNGQPDERSGLRWLILDRLLRAEVPVAVLNPTTVKGYIAGNGHAAKADVKRAVAACWPGFGLGGKTDDECDAVACATAGTDWIGWPGPYLDGRRGAGWLKKAQWPEREAVRA
ncbi:MAG: hypothetical protein EPO40_02850 [Myxococcaceae bacterium]|nr:MAG: hypothetical protein EPO40_02850 [Myxococcaceae bacterium]